MFGTAQPALSPLCDISRKFVERNRLRVDAARIRADVARLPAPRNRRHFPQAMSEADQILMDSFASSGSITGRTVIKAGPHLPGANMLASHPRTDTDVI